jgi:hypothetical protein
VSFFLFFVFLLALEKTSLSFLHWHILHGAHWRLTRFRTCYSELYCFTIGILHHATKRSPSIHHSEDPVRDPLTRCLKSLASLNWDEVICKGIEEDHKEKDQEVKTRHGISAVKPLFTRVNNFTVHLWKRWHVSCRECFTVWSWPSCALMHTHSTGVVRPRRHGHPDRCPCRPLKQELAKRSVVIDFWERAPDYRFIFGKERLTVRL